MQLAVMLQEHVAQRIQDLLYPQEESHQQLLPAIRKLLRLRLALAEFCLAMLEEHCAEEKSQAVARMPKTSVMIALEDFTRCTPEPDSLEQEWVSVGSTLGQVALSQLAAVRSYKLVNMETRARCLTLMGTYLRLQAVHEGPVQMCFLWGRNKQSCCTVSMIAEVLSSACANTSVSQFLALLSFHRKLLLAQEERPNSMLRGVEDSLNSLSKVLGHQLPNA
ncbi:uncharacterized protein LOC121202780 [Betta splendens]|uniref:Uncharacterized protein LOC121202780 n=1 Tax=Betta splendens TaxID=158456 RepID=A0A8M1HND6_BETSP|nr:uncharacterized protein LOC121202780 [Betta splendens]